MWTSCHVNVKTLFFFLKNSYPMKKDFHAHLSLGLFCEPMIVILLQKQKISFLAIRSGSSLISNWIIWKYMKMFWNFQNTGLKKIFFLLFEILHFYYIPLCLGKYYFPKFIGKQEICLLLLKKTSFFWFYMFIISP